MFGYSPTVNDRSGEITAASQLQGAQGMAGGINQAAGGISDAIKQMNQIKMQQQAVAGADAAFRPFAKSDGNPNGIAGLSEALDSIKGTNNPYSQQMSYQLLSQLLPHAMNSNYRNSMMDYRYDSLNQRAGKGTPNFTPVP